jgi:acylpyruvate hydrolase
MRLVSYEFHAEKRLGIRSPARILPLTDVAPGLPQNLPALLSLGASAMRQIEEALRLTPLVKPLDPVNLRLLPPITQAGKILCLGLNYEDHAAESKQARPDFPVIFLRANTSLVAHGEAIVRPLQSAALDFEGELVAVIGRTARHVTRANALDHIAGYSIFNDASIRDYQLRTPQWTVGKKFDGSGAFGPDFVTSDEVPAGASGLSIETRLNGSLMQSANTGHDLRCRGDGRTAFRLHDPGSRRSARDGNTGRRRRRAEAAGLDEARGCRRSRNRTNRYAVESDRRRRQAVARRLSTQAPSGRR